MNVNDLRVRVTRAKEICKLQGLSQQQVAIAVGASQSQVSRILKGQGLRSTRLAEEVCLYAEMFECGVTADAVRRNDELVEALVLAWDGSAIHASALSAVIRSLTVLRPNKYAAMNEVIRK